MIFNSLPLNHIEDPLFAMVVTLYTYEKHTNEQNYEKISSWILRRKRIQITNLARHPSIGWFMKSRKKYWYRKEVWAYYTTSTFGLREVLFFDSHTSIIERTIYSWIICFYYLTDVLNRWEFLHCGCLRCFPYEKEKCWTNQHQMFSFI